MNLLFLHTLGESVQPIDEKCFCGEGSFCQKNKVESIQHYNIECWTLYGELEYTLFNIENYKIHTTTFNTK